MKAVVAQLLFDAGFVDYPETASEDAKLSIELATQKALKIRYEWHMEMKKDECGSAPAGGATASASLGACAASASAASACATSASACAASATPATAHSAETFFPACYNFAGLRFQSSRYSLARGWAIFDTVNGSPVKMGFVFCSDYDHDIKKTLWKAVELKANIFEIKDPKFFPQSVLDTTSGNTPASKTSASPTFVTAATDRSPEEKRNENLRHITLAAAKTVADRLFEDLLGTGEQISGIRFFTGEKNHTAGKAALLSKKSYGQVKGPCWFVSYKMAKYVGPESKVSEAEKVYISQFNNDMRLSLEEAIKVRKSFEKKHGMKRSQQATTLARNRAAYKLISTKGTSTISTKKRSHSDSSIVGTDSAILTSSGTSSDSDDDLTIDELRVKNMRRTAGAAGLLGKNEVTCANKKQRIALEVSVEYSDSEDDIPIARLINKRTNDSTARTSTAQPAAENTVSFPTSSRSTANAEKLAKFLKKNSPSGRARESALSAIRAGRLPQTASNTNTHRQQYTTKSQQEIKAEAVIQFRHNDIDKLLEAAEELYTDEDGNHDDDIALFPLNGEGLKALMEKMQRMKDLCVVPGVGLDSPTRGWVAKGATKSKQESDRLWNASFNIIHSRNCAFLALKKAWEYQKQMELKFFANNKAQVSLTNRCVRIKNSALAEKAELGESRGDKDKTEDERAAIAAELHLKYGELVTERGAFKSKTGKKYVPLVRWRAKIQAFEAKRKRIEGNGKWEGYYNSMNFNLGRVTDGRMETAFLLAKAWKDENDEAGEAYKRGVRYEDLETLGFGV